MLKSLGALIFLALPAAALAQPPPADLSGAWQVTGEIRAGGTLVKATPLCSFRQAGAQLAGACDGPRAQGPARGAVAGSHVSWRWRGTPKTLVGVAGTASFEGDLGADGVIRGTWTTTQLGGEKGTFSAQRR